jgi:dipeptidyl aminopeptidase/acylaminoacyl peptidase
MPQNKLFRAALFCFFTLVFCHSALPQNLSVRDIMREPSIAGMRPDSEKLSPDGKTVIFTWNAEGKEPRNLYIVPASGGEPRVLFNAEQNYEPRTAAPESKLNYGLAVRDDFSKAREKNLFGVEFAPDSKRILFLQNTDIYVLDLSAKDAKPRRITRTQGAENAARWLTNDQILYSSGGNYFILNLRETSLIQITKEANPAAFVSIFNVTATEDGKLAAYVVSDGSKQRALFVPNYLDEFVQTPSTRRGFTEQKVLVTKTDGSLEKPFELKLPKAEGASYVRGVDWAADNRSLIVDRIDKDTKRRQLFYVYNVGEKDEKIITVTEETDEKWIASLSRLVEPNPKNAAEILFASEKDGFNHLYLATLERAPKTSISTETGFTTNVSTKQLTNGSFEIDWAKWTEVDNKIIFSSTEGHTAERQFYVVDSATGVKQYTFRQAGMKNNPQIADDADVLLYEGSQWNAPSEIFVSNFRRNNAPVKITDSTPEKFKQIKWNAPLFVDIPTRDGKKVKTKVYLPGDFNKSKKYPMVMFVHGAGYLQNTINGWNNYYREFMFNDMLTRKGYVVLDIDYRGSAGYGRDWRTDVHDFLGGKDYEDHLDAIDYAVKNYAVDEKNVGVYGGSYGGFMAGMLVTRAPEKIAAAAALRSVFDWKNYYASSPVYTVERLGFPDKNPEAYKRSSPIAYAENLRRPLLILHGLVDDNVPAQDSIQMVEKLMRLEKTQYFEAMFYPSENHGFTRPTSWADEYERIFWFFEKHLKN